MIELSIGVNVQDITHIQKCLRSRVLCPGNRKLNLFFFRLLKLIEQQTTQTIVFITRFDYVGLRFWILHEQLCIIRAHLERFEIEDLVSLGSYRRTGLDKI